MKAAAYCRVSTDKEDQANSYQSQKQYFREYIQRQPDWELYEIYADEGITGTSTKKRAAFNRMMEDAMLGRFDCIITKEVSRFSRNILDTISCTRELKQSGVGVVFMNDGINTLDPDAELRLSIMGSIAQEESRRTSSRVKWGQTRRMEQGVVFGRSMLGYDVKDGRMTINPEGAKAVRLIFHKYVRERKGTVTIARELREAGYQTLTGSTAWSNTLILKILRNEKYCGDLKQKKTYTPDYLTHEKKYNHGEEEFVYLKDHHEPIIKRQLWEDAQGEIARRNLGGSTGTGHGSKYPLSGKIKCSECGKSFVSRERRRRDKSTYRTWRCGTAAAEGRQHIGNAGNKAGCDTGYQLRDDVGIDMIRTAASMLYIDKNTIISNLTDLIMKARQTALDDKGKNIEKMKHKLARIAEKKRNALDAFFSQTISQNDMMFMNTQYDKEIADIAALLSAAQKEEDSIADISYEQDNLQEKITDIVNCHSAGTYFYGSLLECITAHPGKQLEVRLKCLPFKFNYAMETAVDKDLLQQNTSPPISVKVPDTSL